MNKPTVIDLFCGCGGLSKGFSLAGFDVLLGIDSWEDAIKTYKYNFPNAETITGDIQHINISQILSKIGNKPVDVIIGGPPCQGFSLSGKRMIDDERNILYKSFVNIVSTIRPKVFVMENVPGLLRLFDGQIGEQVVHDFSTIGYEVKKQILSADDYGVPQRRQRVFFIGLNKDSFINPDIYKYPAPEYGPGLLKPYVTTKDAISDLDFVPEDKNLGEIIDYNLAPQTEYQRMMRQKSKKLHNHSITVHTERTRQIISMVPDGGNYKNLPKELWSTRKVNIAWTRMNSKKTCFTIDTGHNHHFHYKANRVPTARESARIQSFPDDFIFLGGKTSQLKQIGNAVPPLLASSVAQSIKKILNNEEEKCTIKPDSTDAQ